MGVTVLNDCPRHVGLCNQHPDKIFHLSPFLLSHPSFSPSPCISTHHADQPPSDYKFVNRREMPYIDLWRIVFIVLTYGM